MLTEPNSGVPPASTAVGADRLLRQRLMRAMAQAGAAEIATALEALGPLPAVHDVRSAETGLVMLRGRIGGDGATFNVGEATVSRAVVRSETGQIGFGWRLGRSLVAARQSAVADALLQHPEWRERVVAHVVLPLEAHRAHVRRETAAATAATRVEFFTMARGSE